MYAEAGASKPLHRSCFRMDSPIAVELAYPNNTFYLGPLVIEGLWFVDP